MSAVAKNVATYESSTLPQLPSLWRWVKFSDICERVSVGHVGPTTKYFTGEEIGIPLIRSQNVRPGKLEMDDVAYIVPEFHEKLRKSQLRAGDVLIVRVGANRSDCCVVPDNVSNVNCANIVFARPKFNGKFFSYYFQTHFGRKMLLGATTGAAQEVINTASVANMPVPLPPENVHIRISQIVSNYDDLIENNKRRIELLEESARQLYKEWFVRFRFPGHEHVKIIDGVPDGWDKCQVGDLLTLQRGFDLPVKSRIEGSAPIYASTGINGYHNEAKVKAPGIVTGRSGSLGTVLYVSKDYWPLNTALWVKEFKKVTPYYALFFLRSLKLENYNGGAAVPTLNRNDVHRIETFEPPEKLLEAFTDHLSPIFNQIDTLIEQNSKLSNARDLLLPKLMNGEIAV